VGGDGGASERRSCSICLIRDSSWRELCSRQRPESSDSIAKANAAYTIGITLLSLADASLVELGGGDRNHEEADDGGGNATEKYLLCTHLVPNVGKSSASSSSRDLVLVPVVLAHS
jgi:hypothetical protein